jgi:hypothetical protein
VEDGHETEGPEGTVGSAAAEELWGPGPFGPDLARLLGTSHPVLRGELERLRGRAAAAARGATVFSAFTNATSRTAAHTQAASRGAVPDRAR